MARPRAIEHSVVVLRALCVVLLLAGELASAAPEDADGLVRAHVTVTTVALPYSGPDGVAVEASVPVRLHDRLARGCPAGLGAGPRALASSFAARGWGSPHGQRLGQMHSLVVFGVFVAAVAGVGGAHSNDLIHFGAGAPGRVAPEHEVEAVEGGDGV